MAKVRFVLNRPAFQREVLKSAKVGEALGQALGEGAQVSEGRTRQRAVLVGKLRDEQGSGELSRRLGGARL